jgi:hypothetical protein
MSVRGDDARVQRQQDQAYEAATAQREAEEAKASERDEAFNDLLAALKGLLALQWQFRETPQLSDACAAARRAIRSAEMCEE